MLVSGRVGVKGAGLWLRDLGFRVEGLEMLVLAWRLRIQGLRHLGVGQGFKVS